jgi:membrane protein
MNNIKSRLEAFQRSKPGLLVKKVLDDQAPNLAALLAWGTLSTLLPLMLGLLTIAGLVLRDPDRLDQLYNTLLVMVPQQGGSVIGDALDGIRRSAAPVGVIAIALLLFNGSSFFANMASVFDQIYHVESRNFVFQRATSIVMLIVVTALLIVSTFSLGLGSMINSLPVGFGVNTVAAQVVTWSISILSAFLLFLLLYKLLPNAEQGWRNVIPGAVLSMVLFFVILGVFPIYMQLFPPNQAYAVFGVFLLFTFWLYLLGWVFVLGVELNAFLQEPARAVALAETTQHAVRGKAAYDEQTGQVRAESSGTAPKVQGGGVLGTPVKSPKQQMAEQGESAQGQAARGPNGGAPALEGNRPTFAGRIIGLIGLVIAAILLRNGQVPAEAKESQAA